jgi:hypothetical protein
MQENQLHQHLQQTSSVTPPSQLLLLQQQQQQQQSQSAQQQDQLPQGSQQQVVAQLLGNGSPSVGIGQQGLGVGASAQQVGGLVNTQQQALTRVKLEPQQADQSLQHLQQQLMIPKREMKSEDAVAHQVGARFCHFEMFPSFVISSMSRGSLCPQL